MRRWALNALGMNTHALVREFALAEIMQEGHGRLVVGLLTRNYANGDESRILEFVELPDDADQLHWLLMDVIKVLENNPKGDCSKLGIITYGSTPCENCRFDAARLLERQGVALPWMIEECCYDANEECRELAASNQTRRE